MKDFWERIVRTQPEMRCSDVSSLLNRVGRAIVLVGEDGDVEEKSRVDVVDTGRYVDIGRVVTNATAPRSVRRQNMEKNALNFIDDWI